MDLGSIFALLAVVAAFYFILLRPVLDEQRRRRRDVSTLDVGDEVLTTGGFFATVREIRTSDKGPVEILLEVAPGVTLRATPDAVQRVTARATPEDAGGDPVDAPSTDVPDDALIDGPTEAASGPADRA